MNPEDLDKEKILELYYSTKGNLEKINTEIDAKLKKHRVRKISMFEKYILSRVKINPKSIQLPDFEMSPEEIVYLCCHPELNQVESLDLRKNGFGDIGIKAIADSPMFGNLKELDLRNNRITRKGMEYFSCSKNLRQLKRLDLRLNQVGKIWEQKLKDSGNFPELKEIKIV